MNNNNKLIELIKETNLIINNHSEKIAFFIKNNELKQISALYKKNNSQRNELGFNIFKIISDTFYKENFHSDILKALLEIPEILNEFLDLIKRKKSQIDIINEEYNNSIVDREKGKIDISVKAPIKKKALIIENKINNAKDTERQIPKYNEYLKTNGFKTEAIVYLSLDGNKTPYKDDWTIEEKNEINKKLILIGAYNETDDDIYTMLQSCENLITNIDILLLIRQYKQLLKFLGKNIMNKPIVKQFYEIILEKDNFETASAICDLLQELNQFRALKIKEEFYNNPVPFEEVQIYKETTAYFNNLKVEKSNFAIDIRCNNNEYSIEFFDRNSSESNLTAKNFISDLDLGFIEKENESRLYKIFKFPEEEKEVYKFIKMFKEKLNKKLEKQP